MLRPALLFASSLLLAAVTPAPAPPAPAAVFNPDGTLQMPADYREWIFLTAGYDMSYRADATPTEAAPAHSVFDNVFVNPAAYRVFRETGTWPEGTMFVLENREAVAAASINKRGRTQTAAIKGLEIHLKDSAHSPGGWGFYSFDEGPAKQIPHSAACYSCHEQHAAVDTTFVQFYPTLLPIAEAKKTLSERYRAELAAPAPSSASPAK